MPTDPASPTRRGFLVALAIASAIAAASYAIRLLPFAPFQVEIDGELRRPIGAAIIAIILGVLLRTLLPLPATVTAGLSRTVRVTVPLAILFTGAGLNLAHLINVGWAAIAVAATGVVSGLAGGVVLGRLIGLERGTALLVGAGTGICGTSAVVAVAPLIQARQRDIGLAIGAVNLYGLLIMLAIPPIAGALALSQEAAGMWAGGAVHAVPQAVAAGYSVGTDAGAVATLVKLARVAMLAPLVLLIALWAARTSGMPEGRRRPGALALIPWFVWAFVAMAALNTTGLFAAITLPDALGGSADRALTRLAEVLLTLAMAAIGAEIRLTDLLRVGGRAVAAGLLATLAIAAAVLAAIHALT